MTANPNHQPNTNKKTAAPEDASYTKENDKSTLSLAAQKHSAKDEQSFTQIDWQRFDDGSYSANSYINRELSLLQFHLRVLAQATDARHPLLERLFFLIIFSSNMDEFFEIRVAGIMKKLNHGDVASTPHGVRPSEVLRPI